MKQWIVCSVLLAGVLGACNSTPVVSTPDAQKGQENLHRELGRLPGTLAVTRSQSETLSLETLALLQKADQVLHTYSNGDVVGYVTFESSGVKLFSVFGEDQILGKAADLPRFIERNEKMLHHKGEVDAQAVGLDPFNGGLWAEGVVPYVFDASLSAAQKNAILEGIRTWNTARDSVGRLNRVKFVPKFRGDRPYVKFTLETDSRYCGRSMVGHVDHIFSGWFSHDIRIGCFDNSTIHHEMGHTAGLFHEHQRCDRDHYVQVFTSDVDYRRECAGDRRDYGIYNYGSVMHYGYDGVNITLRPGGPVGSYAGNPYGPGAGGITPRDVDALFQMYSSRTPNYDQFRSGRWFTLNPKHAPHMALDVQWGSANDNTPIWIWPNAWNSAQRWEVVPGTDGFFEVRNAIAGKCLEVFGYATANGAGLVQWGCHGGANQKWLVLPTGDGNTFTLVNKHSNKVLDIRGGGTAQGTLTQQWDYNNSDQQKFFLNPL